MGGKGRRREKNYRAAHGGPARLPPPPDPTQVEAIPSKLRQIMSLTESLHGEHNAAEGDADQKQALQHNNKNFKKSRDSDSEENTMRSDKGGKKNKKRKRNQVTDLRFEMTAASSGCSSKRKERKKKHFEAKKKKHKSARTEENLDFPGREIVKFGDVVEAPPKLVTVPKTLLDASKERLRLQAMESYRSRKGWSSRPGAPQLPPVTT